MLTSGRTTNRRIACAVAVCWVLGAAWSAWAQVRLPPQDREQLGDRPNIVVVMTDDQGYGDIAAHGNRHIKTPTLDRLHAESIRLTNFHVDPSGAPTRAALLTGRYSCTTGVWHSLMGRSLLRRHEQTVGDVFAGLGYRTAVFGKWHLGDNYPFRPQDRGFQETLVHGGGGIGQTPDHWGNSYFDPVLRYNGEPVQTRGYCTDVFFQAAMEFIEAHRRDQFLVYLAPNVPHSPYRVDTRYSQPYIEKGLKPTLAAFYGMITNFDENLGRLLAKLESLGLADNTIVVFLTDNGSPGGATGTPLRGRKGSAYDGGHRVPCFIRWPARLKGGFDVEHLTCHIDLLPTLLELCDLRKPRGLRLDGKSLLPLLVKVEEWYPRTMFVQSHCIDRPLPWRNSAVMAERYNVVVREDEYEVKKEYRLVGGHELYEVLEDPGQVMNIAAVNVPLVDKLRFEYEQWYKDASKRFGEYCEIVLGSEHENPSQLTCFDWHDESALQVGYQAQIVKRPVANGFWAVEFERTGRYRFTLRERPAAVNYPLRAGIARLKIGELLLTKSYPAGLSGVVFETNVKRGKTRLQTYLAETGGDIRGAYFLEVEYLGPAAEKPPSGSDRPRDGAYGRPPRTGAY